MLVLFAIRPRDLDTTEKMGRCVFALGPIVTRAHSVETGALNTQKKKGWLEDSFRDDEGVRLDRHTKSICYAMFHQAIGNPVHVSKSTVSTQQNVFLNNF